MVRIGIHIIEVDRVKRRFIGGRKALVEQEIAAKRAALFETIRWFQSKRYSKQTDRFRRIC